MSEAERRPPGRGSRPAGAGRPSEPPAPGDRSRPDGTRDTLLGALSSRRALRRAILLREALGPPLALRGRSRDTPP